MSIGVVVPMEVGHRWLGEKIVTELRYRFEDRRAADVDADPALPTPAGRSDLGRSAEAGFRPDPAAMPAKLDQRTERLAPVVPAAPFGHRPDQFQRDPFQPDQVQGEYDDGSEPATDPFGLPLPGPARPEPDGYRFEDHRGGGGVGLDRPDVDASAVADPGLHDPGAAQPGAAEPGVPAADVADVTTVLPALRDAVFGRRMTPVAGPESIMIDSSQLIGLPDVPAVVLDSAQRIVRANPAVLALAGRQHEGLYHPGYEGQPADYDDLSGLLLPQLVLGPDHDALLLRPDGSRVRVRVVRWELPARQQTVVLLVELGVAGPPAPTDGGVGTRWTTELERQLRVGRWSYELETGRLQRSETLEELYRSVGIDPDGSDPRAVEQEQVALLGQALHYSDGPRQHHARVALPGAGALSCRAEVECDPDGTALRIVGLVRDLSSDRVSERRLGQSGQRFADLMAMVPGGVALVDPAGRVVDANPGLCELLDVRLEDLRGATAASLCADSDSPYPDALGPVDNGAQPLPQWLHDVPIGARHGYRVGDVALRRSDGTPVWCELAVSATSIEDGDWLWLVLCTDISERRRAVELLRSAGSVDELTRLPNRAASVELVGRLLAGPARNRIAVVCGDIDDFRRVNSSLGHEAGDDLLVMLAGRLQRELPVGCTAGRLSGDEFVVICSDHEELGGPDMLARTVADLLSSTLTVGGRPVQLTASVGVATPPGRGEVRAADLLRFAEVAMHDVKRRQSRGGIGVATDGVVNSALHALELEAELRAAIATGALLLDYQPVVGPDGTVLSAEALVRWPHPVRGLIAPGDFLPVAQRSGLLRELDLWVLRTATAEAATWPEHRGSRPAVAVNLAGLLPADIDFLPVVSDIIADSGLPPERLVLELVETSLVALPPHARAAMAQLVELGVRFAVDDFGTGYSSLGRLKELPAQTVKVDRTFVTDVADDPVDFAVARAVVDMARAMGRTTVAEGVETAEQFHRLQSIGVDAYQGWLFAKALPPAELRILLAGDRMSTPENVASGL